MDRKNYEPNLNFIRFQAKQVKTGSKSNKSNYKFHTKILKQNYINLKLDNKNYIYNL